TFQWSVDNQTGTRLIDLPVGGYSLTVSDANACQEITHFVIDYTVPLSLNITAIEVTCFGDEDGQIWIDSSFLGLQFSLDGSNFQNDLRFAHLATGEYTLSVEDEQGCIFDQLVVINSPQPLQVSLPSDSTIALGCQLELDAFVNTTDPLDYQWSPAAGLDCVDCPVVWAGPLFTTNYHLEVTNERGCTASDEVLIEVEKPREVYIPNAFSPNADGVNDVFTVYAGKGVETVIFFRVFNRWGALVHEANRFPPNESAYAWNGWFRGQAMGPGVFTYVALVAFIDGEQKQYQGDVTLLK
ncbi:MAG: gliding motility-associated C-terminal domain-containing protein, partial [Bacteroidota bacterium]